MYINATLIIQAVHFFIAYIILRKLFFEPALAELELEKQEKLELENSIENVRLSLEKKQQIRDAQWREAQEFYLANKPEIDKSEFYFFREITPGLEAPYVSEHERDEVIVQASSELKDKIKKTYHV